MNATLDKEGYESKKATINLYIIERVVEVWVGSGGGGGGDDGKIAEAIPFGHYFLPIMIITVVLIAIVTKRKANFSKK